LKILFIPSAGVLPVNVLDNATQERLQAGLILWQSGNFDIVLVTGGICQPLREQTISLASLMRDWLLAHGIPSQRVLMETNSRDTFENIKFSLEVLHAFTTEPLEITVVSHWQHCQRFKHTFQFVHGIQVQLHPLPYLRETQFQRMKRFTLELCFLLVHVLDPSGNGKIARYNRRKRTFPRLS